MPDYEWDETRIRDRAAELGLVLAINVDKPEQFRILDPDFQRVATLVTTIRGFEAITAHPDYRYFPVNTPEGEDDFFTALTTLTVTTEPGATP